ncbi:hypothetical protein Tco_0750841 [Tanacetum coccineum]|uniref:Uncharacterized protein n=1 Tax=Tanacetum coccineum TaxID=301880 RepID=A0ABQ4Z2L4_9ASTR
MPLLSITLNEERDFGKLTVTLEMVFALQTPLSSTTLILSADALHVLLLLELDQNIVNNDNYEVVRIRQSSRCFILEPLIGDNLDLRSDSSSRT